MDAHRHHVINLPVKIIVGEDVLHDTPMYLESLGFHEGARIALVTGPHVYDKHGADLAERLEEKGYHVRYWIAPDARIDTAERILGEISSYAPTLVAGLGGGRPIDIGKYVAHRLGRPFISIPTAASHDGIASPFASLKGTGKPTSVRAATPTAIIADVSVIASAPRRLLNSGVGDLVGKFTAVKDWRLAHRLRGEYYGEYAAQLALLSAKHVVRYHELIASGNPEGVRIVVEALISSSVAMCIAGSSRPASGSEHLFSHALDLIAPRPALHGEQVGVGTIMMLYLYGDPRWRRVKRVLQRIGAPTTARELGIPPEIIVKALTIAHTIRPERYTILGDKGLTWEAAEKLARETGVID